MPLLITNGAVLIGDRSRRRRICLLRTAGSPSSRRGKASSRARPSDAGGGYVLPGLIDIHSHGMRDVMVDKDDIFRYAGYQLDNGVTACLPTLAGSPQANMARMKAILAETRRLSLTPEPRGFPARDHVPGGRERRPSSSLARPTPEITRVGLGGFSGAHQDLGRFPGDRGGHAVHPVVREARDRQQHGAQLGGHRDGAAGGGCGARPRHPFLRLFAMPRETTKGCTPRASPTTSTSRTGCRAEIIPDGVHVHPILVEKTLRCKGDGPRGIHH